MKKIASLFGHPSVRSLQSPGYAAVLPRILIGLACVLAATPVAAHPGLASSSFQIVESVPEATIYGEPGIPRTQSVWLQMIRQATQRIDIAAFYITDQPNGPLKPVLDALAARARAGVPA